MAKYDPEVVVGPTVQQIEEQVNRELQRISNASFTQDDFEPERAVSKPLEGMLRFFDPAVYAPGPVKGWYGYQDGEWKYLGPLPDTEAPEYYEDTGHGVLTLATRNIIPVHVAIIPGSAPVVWSVDGTGLFTAQKRFSCNVAIAAEFNVDLNANNQDINWLVFDTVVGGVLIIPPMAEFETSGRVINFDLTRGLNGGMLFDVGDTVRWQSQVLSLTGTTPTVALEDFIVTFTDISIVP